MHIAEKTTTAMRSPVVNEAEGLARHLAPPISLPAGLRWGPSRHEPATLWITGHDAGELAALGRAVDSALATLGRPARLLDDGMGAAGELPRPDASSRVRNAAATAAALVGDGVIAIVVIDGRRVRDRELARLAHEARGLAFYEVFVDSPTDTSNGYEIPPLPDLVVFPGPLVATLASVMSLL